MMIKIFRRSQKLSAVGPVQYLLSERDHAKALRSVQPEILAGNPAVTDLLIDSLPFEHRYVAGCIAFRSSEQPAVPQKRQIMAEFEKRFLAGLTPDRYNILWVEHRDKGRVELNFVVPRVELTTQKSMNIHPTGAKNLAFYNTFVAVMNHRFGYEQVVPDPARLHESEHVRKLRTRGGPTDSPALDSGSHASKRKWHANLVKKIQAGKIRNRPELIQYLRDHGCEFTRIGSDYLSIKNQKNGRAIRFRGYIYENNGGQNYSLERIGNATLTQQHANLLRAKLDGFTAERAQFNTARYKQSRRTAFSNQIDLTKRAMTTEHHATLNQVIERKTEELRSAEIASARTQPEPNRDLPIHVRRSMAENFTESTATDRSAIDEPSPPVGHSSAIASIDLLSLQGELGRLETQLVVAGAKGDTVAAGKIQQQITALNLRIVEIKRQAVTREQEQRLAELKVPPRRRSSALRLPGL
ncbi:relaxase/mobilization nuclease domain-containing protein [Burkholderia thailandensis]|uniref:relaxase/mobilization nuclease domain-containing protein n=1 Tax=Burkholderia thailandensis TaxID=57975 RepID=UPI0022ABDA99|nr:relaxase/mobilization nuclease domain-containing protein [Burkholderia thailandensis]MCZ2895690.1 relaxase/mobilization nuclease domain-containing protein [Burkholderia thailandensis]